MHIYLAFIFSLLFSFMIIQMDLMPKKTDFVTAFCKLPKKFQKKIFLLHFLNSTKCLIGQISTKRPRVKMLKRGFDYCLEAKLLPKKFFNFKRKFFPIENSFHYYFWLLLFIMEMTLVN